MADDGATNVAANEEMPDADATAMNLENETMQLVVQLEGSKEKYARRRRHLGEAGHH